MRHFRLILALISLCFAANIFSGEKQMDSLVIKGIFFAGNEKTKDAVLYREIKSHIGDTLSLELMEEDRKRIQNLRLFTRVEAQPMRTEDGVVLIYYVAERWYIFPYPILYHNEGNLKKISYGVGFLHENFRGMNTSLSSSFWLGYNPGIDFSYFNPWIFGNKQYFLKIGASAKKVRNKSLLYDRFSERHYGLALTLGKRWGYHTYLSIGLGYRMLEVDDPYKEATATGTGSDRLPSVSMAFAYDTRDLHEYPKKGTYFLVSATKNTNLHNIDFNSFGVDIRRYLPIYKGLSFAGRTAVDLTTGGSPVYQNVYLGYGERIRGRWHETREGQNRLLGNWELRFPLLKVRYLNFGNELAPVGPYGNNLPFGISGALFFDTGTVWDHKLDRNAFISGYGFGLNFHVPYFDLIRLEYALNPQRHSEIIFDFLVRF